MACSPPECLEPTLWMAREWNHPKSPSHTSGTWSGQLKEYTQDLAYMPMIWTSYGFLAFYSFACEVIWCHFHHIHWSKQLQTYPSHSNLIQIQGTDAWSLMMNGRREWYEFVDFSFTPHLECTEKWDRTEHRNTLVFRISKEEASERTISTYCIPKHIKKMLETCYYKLLAAVKSEDR